ALSAQLSALAQERGEVAFGHLAYCEVEHGLRRLGLGRGSNCWCSAKAMASSVITVFPIRGGGARPMAERQPRRPGPAARQGSPHSWREAASKWPWPRNSKTSARVWPRRWRGGGGAST